MALSGGPVNDVRVSFQGLAALDRALGKADKNLRTNLRGELKEVAGIVASAAQDIAEQKGLRRSGDLIRKIRPFAYAGRAGVTSTSIHRGYSYPRRLEFEGRGGLEYGPDATLLPALDAKGDELFDLASRLLDKFADDFGSNT